MEILLDDIDKKILEILQLNGKMTNSQLAKEIGLSPPPTSERVKKLEQSGIIKDYHAELDKEKLGLGVEIFIMASLNGSRKSTIESFTTKIQNIREVIECHHVTGSSDFLLKVITKDIKSYNKFILDNLIEIDEIANINSLVVLNTIKNSKVLPV
jgi:Lrp/AsnC family transcriptional regulator, leucine-responsive regulatory protein